MSANKGLFGGAFDPFHIGHLRMAITGMELCQLDELILVPTHTPPHKAATWLPFDQRLAQLEALCQALKLSDPRLQGLSVSDIEAHLPQPSYSLNMVEQLIHNHQHKEKIFFFVGEDSLNSLSSWHQWQKLAELCTFVVFPRSSDKQQTQTNGQPIHSALETLHDVSIHIIHMPTPVLPISSTMIRHLYEEKQSVVGLVPETILTQMTQFLHGD